MNYANIYKEKTPEEIYIILDKIEELSYEAKTALYIYLNEKPEGLAVSEDKLNELQTSFQNEDEDIHSLKYLPNLGLKIKGSMNEFLVKRSGSAKVVDIAGIIVGVLLLTQLKTAYEGWVGIVENGLSTNGLLVAIKDSVIGGFGFILFFKTLYRFMDFISFSIAKKGDKIIITRLDDLKKNTFKVEKSAIEVCHQEGDTQLSFVVDNQKYDLLKSKEGRVLQNTLSRLGELLQE